MIYKGIITSLGDYTEITTQVVRTDGYGHARSGAFDTQKERFINGITIGGKTLGRVSCASNLYPFLEVGKEAELYVWMHPFLGVPPIRTGVLGVVYPVERRAYVSGIAQTGLSLLMLALLPMIWLIPAIAVGGIVAGLPYLGVLGWLLIPLITFSPWLAGGWMLWTVSRLRLAHPYATTPQLSA